MSRYPLLTSRLRLQPMDESHVDAFVAYRRNEDVARWQVWSPDFDRADALAVLASQPSGDLPEPGGRIRLALLTREDGTLVGDVSIGTSPDQPDTYELGSTLDPGHQGRGVATEAVSAVVDMLFSTAGAHRVFALCDVRNTAARRVLERIGLRHESRQLEAEFRKAEWKSMDGYALLAREYAARTTEA